MSTTKLRSPKLRGRMESLSEYIARTMKEKNLKVIDIERRSGGKIVDSYITSLLRGEAKNPSVEKLKALAEGMSVDEDEVFLIARGIESKEWTPRTLLSTMDKIVASSELTRIVKALTKAKPAKVRAVLKIVESEKE
jgi:transcriptional regulator with XRE-family HTH domain